MSRENVEVVRRLMDSMRDRASERIADFWEPDVFRQEDHLTKKGAFRALGLSE